MKNNFAKAQVGVILYLFKSLWLNILNEFKIY